MGQSAGRPPNRVTMSAGVFLASPPNRRIKSAEQTNRCNVCLIDFFQFLLQFCFERPFVLEHNRKALRRRRMVLNDLGGWVVATANIATTYRRPPTVIGVPLEKIGVPLRGAPIFLGGRATKPSVLTKGDKVQIFYLLVRRQSGGRLFQSPCPLIWSKNKQGRSILSFTEI